MENCSEEKGSGKMKCNRPKGSTVGALRGELQQMKSAVTKTDTQTNESRKRKKRTSAHAYSISIGGIFSGYSKLFMSEIVPTAKN